MKKVIFLTTLIVGSLSLNNANAQIGIHLNLNLGSRPVYVELAPIVNDDYYYLPDAEAYYSVPEHVYYYQNEGRWVSSPRLVGRFHDYDYSRLRHYEVKEARPYLRNDYYRNQYRNTQGYTHDDRDFRNQNYNANRGRDDNHRYNYHDDHQDHDQHYNTNYQRGEHDNRNYKNGYSRY